MTLSLLRRTLVAVAPLVLAAPALANEAAAPALKASVPAVAGPYLLGAPPAWVVMILGLTVISLTVLRRARKGADARRPSRG
ncbi:MAG: hypothetical protein FJ296_03460 [Planctomycetes bacterium]|nr:hypothetical protein [Planctomycetota bacterium]